ASYEDDRATEIPLSPDFMALCRGKAVKVLDPHRHTPPSGFRYRVIWMRRNLREQARSLVKFLRLVGGVDIEPDRDVLRSFENGIENDRIAAHRKLRPLADAWQYLHFEDVLARPIDAASMLAVA